MCEEPLHIPTELDFSMEDPFCVVYHILGSCDGLFCISRDFEDLFIWNPSTRKLKKLSSSGSNVRVEEGNHFSYGFGYVESLSDYRVVEIVESSSNNCYKNDVSVYSLRTNSWKTIQECPTVNFLDQAGKFVNGKLHWVVADRDRVNGRNCTWFISSFDLADETFGDVVLPDPNDDYLDCEIGSSGGSLCFFSYSEIKMDVWVMKEYKLAESWTKVASIPSENCKSWPIFISQNDKILVHDCSSLVWYNSRDNTFIRPVNQIRCVSANNFSIYIESLVSPNSVEEE